MSTVYLITAGFKTPFKKVEKKSQENKKEESPVFKI